MANLEHLAILKQGVDAWNQWREENPNTSPDLRGADLIGMILRKINFAKTDLVNVQLDNADLEEADFSDAIMNHVVLRGANLNGAYLLNARLANAHLEGIKLTNTALMGASFRGANLLNANLTGSSLWITNLAQANLTHADFTDAVMGYSYLEFLDLRKTKGLETVTFTGPLSIGIETLYMSDGQIPIKFLRDAGIPENLIEYLPSLTNKAFEFYDCFISVSEKDYDFANKLWTDLRNAGVRCWIWREDMRMGHDMWASIDIAIKKYDKVIVVCSQNSLTSPAVLREIERALQKEDDLIRQEKYTEVLFPIRLDDFVITNWNHHRKPDLVKKYIGDFRNWRDVAQYEKLFMKLLDAINKRLDVR